MMLRAPLLPAFLLAGAASALALAAGCGSAATGTSGTGGASSSAGSGGTDGGTGTGGTAPTTFPCKNVTCKLATDACKVSSHLGQNEMGACFAPPPACLKAGATCSCFTDLMGCMCQKEPDGTFALFCEVM